MLKHKNKGAKKKGHKHSKQVTSSGTDTPAAQQVMASTSQGQLETPGFVTSPSAIPPAPNQQSVVAPHEENKEKTRLVTTQSGVTLDQKNAANLQLSAQHATLFQAPQTDSSTEPKQKPPTEQAESKSTPTFVVLLKSSATPDELIVADKPLPLGGQERRLDKTAITQRLSFTYCESVVKPQYVEFTNLWCNHIDNITVEYFEKKILERLDNPLHDSFAICFIGDTVGYGVFARKPVKAGTVIGIYAGVIEGKDNDDHEYALTTGEVNYKINARNVGGITRFIQHLPYSFDNISKAIKSKKNDIDALIEIFAANGTIFDTKIIRLLHQHKSNQPGIVNTIEVNLQQLSESTDELQAEFKKYPFLGKIKDLATANLLAEPITLDEITIFYLRACTDIGVGEQLGFSYGLEYWKIAGKSPSYFDKSGRIISIPKDLADLKKNTATHGITLIPSSQVSAAAASSFANNPSTLFTKTETAKEIPLQAELQPSCPPTVMKQMASDWQQKHFYPTLDEIAKIISANGYKIAPQKYSKSSPQGWLLYKTTDPNYLVAALSIAETEQRDKLVEILKQCDSHTSLQIIAMKSGNVPVLTIMFKVDELGEKIINTIRDIFSTTRLGISK